MEHNSRLGSLVESFVVTVYSTPQGVFLRKPHLEPIALRDDYVYSCYRNVEIRLLGKSPISLFYCRQYGTRTTV